MAEPGFWDNQEQAQSLINDTNRMKEKSENFKQLEQNSMMLKLLENYLKQIQPLN